MCVLSKKRTAYKSLLFSFGITHTIVNRDSLARRYYRISCNDLSYIFFFSACKTSSPTSSIFKLRCGILHGTVGKVRENWWKKHTPSSHIFRGCGSIAIFATFTDCSSHLFHDLQIFTRTTLSATFEAKQNQCLAYGHFSHTLYHVVAIFSIQHPSRLMAKWGKFFKAGNFWSIK